jgi:hypothetical protein
MSERPAGNLFSTIAKAYTPAVDEYLKGQETEDSFQRQLKLAGATQAIQSEEAKAKYEKELAIAKMKLEQDEKEAFIKSNADLRGKAPGVFDNIKQLQRSGESVSKIRVDSDLVVSAGGKKIPKPKQEEILTIPDGQIFWDSYGFFYKRSKDTPGGFIRLEQGGQQIPSAPAPAKSPGFFESPGAAYDPRAWNKQKFYDSLVNKNKTSNME